MILRSTIIYTWIFNSIQVETCWPFHPKKVAKSRTFTYVKAILYSYSIVFSLVHHQAKKMGKKVTRVAFAGLNQDSSFWCKNCRELKSEKYDFSPQCFRRNLFGAGVGRRFLQYCSCKSLKVCKSQRIHVYMVYLPTFTIKKQPFM